MSQQNPSRPASSKTAKKPLPTRQQSRSLELDSLHRAVEEADRANKRMMRLYKQAYPKASSDQPQSENPSTLPGASSRKPKR